MDSREWVLVAEFYLEPAAKAALALLRSAAIPSFLKGSITALQLMAPPSFLEQARELLRSEISEEDLIAQAEAAPAEPAPSEDLDDGPRTQKS